MLNLSILSGRFKVRSNTRLFFSSPKIILMNFQTSVFYHLRDSSLCENRWIGLPGNNGFYRAYSTSKSPINNVPLSSAFPTWLSADFRPVLCVMLVCFDTTIISQTIYGSSHSARTYYYFMYTTSRGPVVVVVVVVVYHTRPLYVYYIVHALHSARNMQMTSSRGIFRVL